MTYQTVLKQMKYLRYRQDLDYCHSRFRLFVLLKLLNTSLKSIPLKSHSLRLLRSVGEGRNVDVATESRLPVWKELQHQVCYYYC